MNALFNAHVTREDNISPRVGFASGGLPEAMRSQTGVSLDYVLAAGCCQHVQCAACHCTDKVKALAAGAGMQGRKSMRCMSEKEIGKNKQIVKPLLPNLFFVCMNEKVLSGVTKATCAISFRYA